MLPVILVTQRRELMYDTSLAMKWKMNQGLNTAADKRCGAGVNRQVIRAAMTLQRERDKEIRQSLLPHDKNVNIKCLFFSGN